VRGSENVQFGV